MPDHVAHYECGSNFKLHDPRDPSRTCPSNGCDAPLVTVTSYYK